MPPFRFPFRHADQIRRDVEDELDFHLACAIEALERDGLPPAEARAEALARLGDRSGLARALYRIDHRTDRRLRLMTTAREFVADLRFALRRMRRRPLLTGATALTLALGIGTAVTFLGAADAILLRPLPLRDAERVVALHRTPVADPTARSGLAPGTLADLGETTRSLAAVTGAQPFSHRIERDGERLSIGSWRVTPGFFEVLRTEMLHGRALDSADFVPGGEPVAVVATRFWRTHLGADPLAVGRLERLNGTPHRIVGVLPDDFPYAEGRELYVPQVITGSFRENRVADYWSAYGRLAEGASLDAVRSELAGLAARSDARAGPGAEPRRLVVERLSDTLLGEVRPGLALLAVGAVLVLLMAATNASGLLIADAMGRARELAVRAAVGAGRDRIARQLGTEAFALALLAGLGGFAIGAYGLGRFRTWAPPTLPRLAELTVDLRLAAIATVSALVVLTVVGLASTGVSASSDLHSTLKGAADADARRGRRWRTGLVATQVALAVLLLCSGGLLARSWVALTAVDQGYDPAGVVAIEQHVYSTHAEPAARVALGVALPERLAALPGVEAAALATDLPLAAAVGDEQAEVALPGAAAGTVMHGVAVTPGYFAALRIPQLDGRLFDATDGPGAEPVAILSANAAARLFPGEDAVGRSVIVVNSGISPGPRRIVGVVGAVRYASLELEAEPTVYLPHAQAPSGSLFIVMRQRGGATTPSPQAVAAIRELVVGTALNERVALAVLHRAASVPRRFSMLLLGAFAGVALLLTSIGLFGLLVQVVRQRERELGVRLALGAWPAELRAMLLGEGLRLTALGLAVGVGAFLLASGALRGLLYGVPARDPLTVLGVAILVLTVAACASWWPATLATRVDPLRALRAE